MHVRVGLAVVMAALTCAPACVRTEDNAPGSSSTTEKPFAAGGNISVQLTGGSYEIKPAAEDRIRVTLSGNLGAATADISTGAAEATVAVKNTPTRNFNAVIELPQTSSLQVRLSGGDLNVGAFGGNKDVESGAGNVDIAVGDPNDYASVDAAAIAGDITAGLFEGSRSGLNPHFTWSGPGRHTLRARLGAGNLTLHK